MSISRAISQTLADDGGGPAVEFALVAPVMAVFLVGMIDMGNLAFQKAEVSAAANAGALYAIHNGGGSLSSIASAVTSATPLTVTANPSPSQVYACSSGGTLTFVAQGATCSGGGTAGTYVEVNATASYAPLVTWGNKSSTLTAQAIVRIQ